MKSLASSKRPSHRPNVRRVPPHPLFRQIQNGLRGRSPIQAKQRILIAVSGGPDSVFLLIFLSYLAPRYDLHLGIAHLNHGLRGLSSDKDEQFVQSLGGYFDLPVYTKRIPPGSPHDEASLRTKRYSFLRSVAAQHHYGAIAVAHTLDDQAETVLEHLLRGSGVVGLSGMALSHMDVLRPLLYTRRNAIVAYLRQNCIQYRIDRSNFDTRYLRNRLRRHLLPWLTQKYRPDITLRLAEVATRMSELRTVLDALPLPIPVTRRKAAVTFSQQQYLALLPPMRRHLLYLLSRQLLSETAALSSRQIMECDAFLQHPQRNTHHTGGLILSLRRDIVTFALSPT